MMRYIMPIVLVGIAITTFFLFTDPLYNSIDPASPGVKMLTTEVASYNEALNNSKMLESERDKLATKFNAIDPDNLIKLQKLLPENVDNIRLILEIEKIAAPFGMVLKDVKYNTAKTDTTTTPAETEVRAPTTPGTVAKDYDVFDLEFSTSGSYNNFVEFTKSIESNLRIVDISSISFSSNSEASTTSTSKTKTNSSEVYSYSFKIRTYWLKN